MANRSARKRLYSVAELGLNIGDATTGVWTLALAAGIFTLNKAAAATNTVLTVQIPSDQKESGHEDGPLSSFKMFYQVTTANITTAPSVVLSKISHNTTTGVVSSAAVPQAITFGGIDTIGKVAGAGAAGSHIAIVTVTTPTALADNEALYATFTMGEAATTVLDISGFEFNYN